MRSLRSIWTSALAAALAMVVSPVSAQTITNTARATWTEDGVTRDVLSNTVSVDVAEMPVELITLRPTPGGSSASLPITSSMCGGQPLNLFDGASSQGGMVNATATDTLQVGETLILQFSAPAANHDPAVVDSVTAVLTTPSGDEETIEIFETGADTGVFTGAIQTRAIPPGIVRGDCQLSVQPNEKITVAVDGQGSSTPIITTLVGVLADPFGYVFDSETGEPVSGAQVTLVDAATGQPANVYAADGVTRWPSSVVTGQPITDAAGNVYPMAPGEYWFPLAALGNYRLVVIPPSPYTAPSTATPAQLAGLSRPEGGPFHISDASFGGTLTLSSPEPVRVDIPVDHPNIVATVTKQASREIAQPGDAVFYTITITNPDTTRVKRNVVVSDNPSASLRLRPDSIRVDGQPADGIVTVSEDGRHLTFTLPQIGAGASVRITYAMTIRPDAAPGQAVNRAEATDQRGGSAADEAVVRVERDVIAGRMTIIGRVTEGACTVRDNRPGIPGVRVMLEDGSFAITDRDGRYHFEGVVPGTHVVQVQRQTLPKGGDFVDCDRSTRTSGSPISRFVIGQGGSLMVADFTAVIPGWKEAREAALAAQGDKAAEASPVESVREKELRENREAAGAETDWLAAGDGPTEFLFPAMDHNPRAPSIRVVIRHEVGETVELFANNKPVDSVAFEGARPSADKSYAISSWRGVSLQDTDTVLHAIVHDKDGKQVADLTRKVAFVSAPWNAEIIPERSTLVADGETRPVVAVRLTDRQGRPVRSGVSGSVTIGAPYESAAMIDQMQLGQLTGQGSASPNWTIASDDGVALIELAPTMVSGPLHLEFNFAERDLKRRQPLETWVTPGDLDWTIVGLAEGSVGERTVADNMERTGRFDSDLGDNARVALYAKGRVLGKFLLTVAYDSAKQEDDQRLLGTIDPNAYYTVFADGSDRRFDAASREKLYVRVETSTFYALYGDFVTGFDQTVLGRYQRTTTGVKAEGRFGALHAQGFAAKIATRYRHDEIQGAGITGPYRLNTREVLANSEKVAIEVRDRFRSEVVIQRRELTRFIDYDLDILSGTITFKEPVLSRDFDLNPQFIVVDYEVQSGSGDAEWNAGVRADYTVGDDALRIGVTAITDKGEGERTDIGAVDLRARIGDTTEVRAELGLSRSNGNSASGWLVEAEHRTGSLDVLAYARSMDADYGTGQQSGAERGRQKFGVDGRYAFNQHLSVVGSAWYDESLTSDAKRRALQLTAAYRTGNTEARLGISHFSDNLADGSSGDSTVVEGGVSQRLFGNRLELSATTSFSIDKAESIDLPARHRLRARYSVTDWLNLVGSYEIADGETLSARTLSGGVEVQPWSGAKFVSAIGQQDIDEYGKRSYASFGLSQSMAVSSTLTLDATVDGNRALSGANVLDVVNTGQPVASGGHISQDGAIFEDFTALTLGASWRKDRWSATMRGEYRDGEFADRKGVTLGVVRQLGEGVMVGTGASWTNATAENGSETEVLNGAVSMAYRPDESEFAFLGKVEYRSDRVTGAVAGEVGGAGRTALYVDGDARSDRLIASFSTNWSPRGTDDWNDDGVRDLFRRSEFGLFLGARYNFDRMAGFDLAGTTLLGGLDARIGIGDKIEIGGMATVRTNVTDGVVQYALGPQIGFVPVDGTLVTLGYNFSGFRDPDFSASRMTDDGFYASIRLKFDADTFGFLGLNR